MPNSETRGMLSRARMTDSKSKAWVFLDEQGDVKFGERNSPNFGVAAVVTNEPGKVVALLDSIRHAHWSSDHVTRGRFHAHDDCPAIRESVFHAIREAPLIRCDVVSLQKGLVYQQLRTPRAMYRAALRVLFRYTIPRLASYDELMIVASEWSAFRELPPLIGEVLTVKGYNHPVLWTKPYCAVQALSASHGCLQVADYVAWASNRRRTRDDDHWEHFVTAPGRDVSDFVVGA